MSEWAKRRASFLIILIFSPQRLVASFFKDLNDYRIAKGCSFDKPGWLQLLLCYNFQVVISGNGNVGSLNKLSLSGTGLAL